MKKVIMLSLLFMVTSNVFAIPTITTIATQGATIKFIAVLSEKLPIGYKVKVDYSNGKGLVAMTCSGGYCTLSSNTLPTGVASAIYNIGIYIQCCFNVIINMLLPTISLGRHSTYKSNNGNKNEG
jgi:uncharacterized ion transporter superfamily protein YfcC